jgi:hypothetical protein
VALIDKIEQAARDLHAATEVFRMAARDLEAEVALFGCKLEVCNGTISVKCEKRALPLREWLAIKSDGRDGGHRRATVHRRTGMLWDPVHNSHPNVAFDGGNCADDDR